MKAKNRVRALGGMLFFVMAACPFLSAATYDLKEMTPQVRQALANRQARYATLQQLKAQGAIGENNRGYAAALKDMSGAAGVVASENQDRRIIYQAIAVQNNLGPTGLAIVETVFSEVHHEKARPGDPIQMANGSWVEK